MRKLKFLCLAAIALFFVGCNDEMPGGGQDTPNIPADGEGVYVALNIQMPSRNGNRSFTDGENSSNNGVEIGKDYENNVSEAIIVLANANDYGFIAAAPITSKTGGVVDSNPTFKTISKFSKTQLETYYTTTKNPDPSKVTVFVFCNPNLGLRDYIMGNGTEENKGIAIGNTEWVDEAAKLVVPASIWTPNQFLMSNNSIAERLIPKNIDGWVNYNLPEKAFNLSGLNTLGESIDNSAAQDGRGNVKVERSAARMDFRDASGDGEYGSGDNTYYVVKDEEGNALVNVQLHKMALVNMNNKFYFLRRTSPTGLPTDIKLCGPELPWFSYTEDNQIVNKDGNYVVDAWAEWKASKPTSGFKDHFNYYFFNDNGTIDNTSSPDRWGTSLISTVLGNSSDNDEKWNPGGKEYPDYKIWRYLTENTIPGTEQLNGITTGVVFKGRMIGTEDAANSTDAYMKELAAALNSKAAPADGDPNKDPILYSFNNDLYLTWAHVREAALSQAISNLTWVSVPTETDANAGYWKYDVNRESNLYVAVFGKGGFGTYTFKYTANKEDGSSTQETATIKDDLADDTNSCNAVWNVWDEAGRPSANNDDKAKVEINTKFKSTLTAAKFTLYQRSYDSEGGWGYYCYYYYWNRHNDNGNNGIMGPMEFAVVRNNVYKLAVTKISQLGHPRITENDPNKPEPGTPDESEDVYITVTAEVLPWVVRVNNIEF